MYRDMMRGGGSCRGMATMATVAGTLLLLLCWSTLAEGIQVIVMQKDGVARTDTQAVYQGVLNPAKKLTHFTFCARVKLFNLHGRGTFLQVKNGTTGNMIRGEVWLDRVRPVISGRFQFQLLKDKLRTRKWYHFCFTYSQNATRYRTYQDGEKVFELIYDVVNPVVGDYARVGQSSKKTYSLSGEVSQVNVWDYMLPETEIKAMAKCQLDKQGNYISWDRGWTLENVESYDAPISIFCHKSTTPILFAFPKFLDFKAYYICRALGATLPIPHTHSDGIRYIKLMVENWPNDPHCHGRLWTPLIDETVEGHWVRRFDNKHVPMIPWRVGEPNGIWYENCGFLRSHGQVDDDDCKNNIDCATCEFTDLPVFRFVGICERELRNMYFVTYQTKAGQLVFRGYSDYNIELIDGRWKWYNKKNNETMAIMIVTKITIPHFPMGRRNWEIVSPICGQQDGNRELLLTHCEENEFTCDDATCIPLKFRCDQKYDCIDHSDENFCNIVVFPDSYKKDLTPRSEDENSKSLPILLNTIIKSIDVDTMKTTMTLAFELHQTWFDNRLQYINLKVNENMNRVASITIPDLWSPVVSFVNTPDNQHTQVDAEVAVVLQRLSEPSNRDPSSPAEVDLYPGTKNTLKISRAYNVKFVCDFNLIFYPFDNQVCDMRMRMMSASAIYLKFEVKNSTIAYLGSNFLIEYEIVGLEVLEGEPLEFSEILMRVKLERRYGYAVLTIYTPSLILLAISYVTLFFTDNIFEVRVMAALTTLLVVSTIFTQASGSLPRTSYFKFVDIWLLFCIAIIFLIIIFHTIIDIYINRPQVLENTVSMFLPSPEGNKNKTTAQKHKSNLKNLIYASRMAVLGIFILFNLIYWGQIFF